MQLQTLQLINFRNYTEVKLNVAAPVVVLVGSNGSGKTNLLDAIHYLSLTKSAVVSNDSHSVRNGEKFFSIKGTFRLPHTTTEIFCAVQSGKKIFREGSNDYAKLSDHVGKFPVVLIAPDDTDIVKEGSEERRKFFDSIISQLDRNYLEALIQYNHLLRQRNSLLKMFAENTPVDEVALESYDQGLVRFGNIIHHRRRQFIDSFTPVFQKFYRMIVEDEPAGVTYDSELARISYEDGLIRNRQRDFSLLRTNFGVHRDDYRFDLLEGDLRKMGSQGQRKSFVIALKLSQFEILKENKRLKPILLLDDIFDKLDDHRIRKLLEMIRNNDFGQLFITDARPDRTSALLDSIQVPAKIFHIEKGVIVNENG
jgi:DNA replication and repair protein RecF